MGESNVLSRGVALSAGSKALGLLGVLWLPLASFLYGASAVGEYFLVLPIAELMITFLSSGATDAVVVFGSEEKSTRGEGVVRAALAVTVIVAALAGALLWLASPWVATFSAEPVRWVAFSVPLSCATQLLLALSKTDLRFGVHAFLTGAVRPALLPLSLVGVSPFLSGGRALVLAYVLAQASFFLTTCAALLWFKRPSLNKLRGGDLEFRRFLKFALPQTFSLTLNRYNARLDLLMLGAFGTASTQIALYGSVTWLLGELRMIRLTVGGVLMPLVSRLGGAKKRSELLEVLNRASRWTASLIAGALLLVVGLLPLLLSLLLSEKTDQSLVFAWVLLLIPLISGSWGLAGNFLVALRRQKWTLANAMAIAVLNTGLNLVLIPRWGLLGAATATLSSVALVTGLEVLELQRLERLGLRLRSVWMPFVAFSCCLPLLLALTMKNGEWETLPRILLTVSVEALYLFLLWAFRLPEFQMKRGRA